MSQKAQKKNNNAKSNKNDYIQLGAVKLSNVDLQNIVRKSEELPDLENDQEFMKSLDEYAQQKSKEIIDSTVRSDSVLQKKAQKTGQKAPSVDRTHHYVNPGGSSSAFFKKPLQDVQIDDSYRLMTKMQPLELSQLFFKPSIEIAQHFLNPSFPYTFQFTLDVYFGITGIVRQCSFNFIGPNTFNTVNSFFRHKFCHSENFQWFYLNHYGRLMEIHDTLSLKQALINFGAFPRGTCDPSRESARILCITRCVLTEDEIFDKESDLIMGYNNILQKQGGDYLANLPFQLAADHRFFKMFHVTVMYSEAEKRREYNDYDEIGHLISFCQRKMDIEECFDDERGVELATNDLKQLIDNRFSNPYKHYNRVESANLELKSVLEMLKKSKYQTAENLQYIEHVLRDRIRRLK